MSPSVTCRSLAVFLLGSLLAGCASVALLADRCAEPTIELVSSKVTDLSPTAASLVFSIAASNTNTFGLPLRAIDFRLSIGSSVLATGHQRVGLVLPPAEGGTMAATTMTIVTNCRMDELVAASPVGVALGEIPYRLDLIVDYGTWVAQRKLEWHGESALSLNLPLGLAGTIEVDRYPL